MDRFQTSYQPLSSVDDDVEEHVPINVVTKSAQAKWSHVPDLDVFFKRVYNYFHRRGFKCMILEGYMGQITVAFIVILSTSMIKCVDYDVLFHNKDPRSPSEKNSTFYKITIRDVIIPADQCFNNFDGILVAFLIAATIFWILYFGLFAYESIQYLDIKNFYESALNIPENEVAHGNITWHDILKRLQEFQLEYQMCINCNELTEADVYHRILRFDNYMVAMEKMNVLPVKFSVLFLGEIVFFTESLKFCYKYILFFSCASVFENSWNLKKEYKKPNGKHQLAAYMSKTIVIFAGFILLISPVIFCLQILYCIYKYAETFKRDAASILKARQWSLYAKLCLRHYNELDHELNARLNRAYKFAKKYMGLCGPISPMQTILARNVISFLQPLLSSLIVLALYDEDVFQVEHVLTIMSVLTAIVIFCYGLIADKKALNFVQSSKAIMASIFAELHYMPDHWKDKAHTKLVRGEFAQLFQSKSINLFQDLLSPFICPIMLYFYLRPKTLDIVNFVYDFSIHLPYTGDVCWFALVDSRKHGQPKETNTTWTPPTESTAFPLQSPTIDMDMFRNLLKDYPLGVPEHSIPSLSELAYNLPVIMGNFSQAEGPCRGSICKQEPGLPLNRLI